MDGLSRTYARLLAGSYDCVDRIVLNAFFSMGHTAGGFRTWWRALTGSDEKLDNAHLMRMAGRFGRRVHAWAAERRIPIKKCAAGEQKHEIGDEHLASTQIQEGVFLILVGRAQAPVWNVQEGGHIGRKKPSPFVSHYFFHILDADWGHVTIRMSGHPPFPAQIILNGHEYVARQARKAGIVFHEGNCFTHISDGPAFAQIADTLTEESVAGRLAEVCDRSIYTSCLCFALQEAEQKRSGFWYQYSTFQFEYSRNLLFARGSQMTQVLEALVDRNRVRMDVPMLKTILGRQQRPHYRKRRRYLDWYITVERPSYDLTVFKVHCGKLALKIYSKGERVLRAEAMAQNAEVLKCGRLIQRFAVCAQKLKLILQRFLDSLSCMDNCFISDGQWEELPDPGMVGKTRVGGIDVNRTRMHRVKRALLALASSPGGFTAARLANHVVRQTALTEYEYSSRQASYDLRKFRAKGLVTRIGNSHKYEVRLDALRFLSGLLLLHGKLLRPLIASAVLPDATTGPTHPTALDERYAALRAAMSSALQELGVAA